jgi:hypothetical protein
MPDITSDPHRRRPVPGWVAVATGLVIFVWRGSLSIHWWRLWRQWREADPSGAEVYELSYRIEAAMALIGLAIAVIGLWLIRRIGRRPMSS